MNDTYRCARCKESFEEEPVVKLGEIYCSAACAFEATERPKPKQCGVPVADTRSNGTGTE